jgi:uncharacterized phage-associated protein
MKIKYNPNFQKIIESILWFAARSQRTDIHSILKELFYSDKLHLRKYGRPVTGDDWHRMEYGPVASYAYDFLKHSRISEYVKRQRYTPDILEEAIRAIDVKDPYKIKALREADLDCFSGTDIECMTEALDICNGKDFNELVEMTHKEAAWRNAADNGEMAWEDFLEGVLNKEDRLEYIRETASCLAL